MLAYSTSEINMRWTKTIPAYGSIRSVTKFLITPTRIYTRNEDGSKTVEERWLETSTWEEKWTQGRKRDFWKFIRWID